MEREEECDWYPTPHLRMCLGILQQQWRRVLLSYQHYNGSSRPLRCQKHETEWRDVRQATDEEIAEIKARAGMETSSARRCRCGQVEWEDGARRISCGDGSDHYVDLDCVSASNREGAVFEFDERSLEPMTEARTSVVCRDPKTGIERTVWIPLLPADPIPRPPCGHTDHDQCPLCEQPEATHPPFSCPTPGERDE